MTTKNYGLAGGTLDASQHIENFKDPNRYNRILAQGTALYRLPGGQVGLKAKKEAK